MSSTQDILAEEIESWKGVEASISRKQNPLPQDVE
jgi:hypothetical protein